MTKPIRKTYRIKDIMDNTGAWRGYGFLDIEVGKGENGDECWSTDELHNCLWHSKADLVAWLRAAADVIEKTELE